MPLSPKQARINKNGKEATVSVLSFKKAMVKYLFEDQNYRKRKATNGGLSDHRHCPKKTTSARRCKNCITDKKRSESRTYAKDAVIMTMCIFVLTALGHTTKRTFKFQWVFFTNKPV